MIMLNRLFVWRASVLVAVAMTVMLLVASCGSAVSESGDSDAPVQSEAGSTENPKEDNPETDNSSDQANQAESTETPIVEATESATVSLTSSGNGEQYQGVEVGFTDDGHPYRGSPDAPIIIMEFSDYQCPFCGRFFEQTMPSLVENEIASGDALLVFYDFPLINIHPQAVAAANAARCAGKQGADAYWAMHDLLFGDIEAWSNSGAQDVFSGYAEKLELDLDKYDICLSENTFGSEIEADLRTGSELGISGTPSFVINGQLLVGAQPLAVFEEAIATVKNGGQLASNEPEAQQNQPQAAPTPAALLSEYAATLGDPDAPVKIVEFTDYQCPYCSRHSLETLPRIINDLIDTGRVFYAQKDLPLDQLHPNARIAAAAARCAADQGAYWEMHDTLFAQQSEWAAADSSVIEIFASYAVEHDIDEASFVSCLESGQYDAAVEANAREARSLGISGTPFFFVDGYPLNGARPYEHFELAVEYAEDGRLAEAYAPPPEDEPQQPTAPLDVPIGDAYSIGDIDAPITIVEYTDFQCPFCSRHFTQTYPQIAEQYIETGIVRYVFKDFPLTSIHPQAVEAAEAARCAGDQGMFLDMYSRIFMDQAQWSGIQPTELFSEYAAELDLDMNDFGECLESGKYEAEVNADLQEGLQLGVTGTPAFFVNGFPISGAQPFEVFEQYVEGLLADTEN